MTLLPLCRPKTKKRTFSFANKHSSIINSNYVEQLDELDSYASLIKKTTNVSKKARIYKNLFPTF